MVISTIHSVASGQQPTLVVDTVSVGLRTPKSIAVLNQTEALVAHDRYHLSRLNLITGAVTALNGGPKAVVPRRSTAETGILDIAPHPGFAGNGLLYLSAVVGDSNSSTLAVIRGRLSGNVLIDTTTLVTVSAWGPSEAHFGGRLALRDGYLFISVGEREQRARAQDPGSHIGKILRVHDDGRVPIDNPYVGRGGALPEIWSHGHRNPQGLAFDTLGALWANEHGPRHGDELNRIQPAGDYGWPRVSFGWEYTGGAVGSGFTSDSMAVSPLHVWTPTIAPGDLLIHSGRGIWSWRGNFLTPSLSQGHLNRLVWNGQQFINEEKLFISRNTRMRSIAEGVDGSVYVGTDDGAILRVRGMP